MKKLALLIGCVFIFTSCTVDDDGPNIVRVPAEVTNADLPEYFEEGKSYEVDVTYLLPTACHTVAGLQVSRGGATGEQRRDIYVVGIANIDANLTECNKEGENLEKTGTFTITIDEAELFTFYLWTGINEDNEDVFTTIIVPIGAPDDEGSGGDEITEG